MDNPLVILAGIFVLGIGAQWLAWRMRLPAILLLLGAGFAAGQFVDVGTVIAPKLLQAGVALSVAVILFEGGLTLRLAELKDTGGVVLRLVTIGCVVTWVIAAIATWIVLDDWRLATLAGALYTVTGPTVIGPLLRHVRPVQRLGAVAKWEGIVIDPIGAVLAVLVFVGIEAGSSSAALDVVVALGKTVVVGGALGWVGARGIVLLFKRHWVPDYLHNPVVLAVVLGTFSAADLIQHEAGLAAVTLLGVLLANQKTVAITHLVEFKENLGVLLISALFIVLSARLDLSSLQEIGWGGVAVLAVLILVARPASVWLATLGTSLNWKERCFLGWLAPRGIVAAAVASVFALELQAMAGQHDVSESFRRATGLLVPLTFVIIIGTVTVYGLTAGPLASWLGLADSNPQGIVFAGADKFVRDIAEVLHGEGYRVVLVDTNSEKIKAARMAGLETCRASIVSEYVEEELDLGGVGRLLAMTPNDQVNSLACVKFIERFERADVFQLPYTLSQPERRDDASSPLRGRFLFDVGLSHTEFTRRMREGASIKATRLSEEFDALHFLERYGESAVVLFLIEKDKLQIATVDESVELKPGQTVIALVNTPAELSKVDVVTAGEPT